jgi:hypothetical protein
MVGDVAGGPSRKIQAIYDGGPTILPAGGTARIVVRQGQAHQHHPQQASVGQDRPDLRSRARWLLPRGQQAASPRHRRRRAEQDPGDPEHRTRRPIQRDIHVRHRPRGRAVLVHGVHAQRGWISVLARAFAPHDRRGRRANPPGGTRASPRSPTTSPQAAKPMIARHRGDHDNYWGRWRPTTGREPSAAMPRRLEASTAHRPAAPHIGRLRPRVRRTVRLLIALATVV